MTFPYYFNFWKVHRLTTIREITLTEMHSFRIKVGNIQKPIQQIVCNTNFLPCTIEGILEHEKNLSKYAESNTIVSKVFQTSLIILRVNLQF